MARDGHDGLITGLRFRQLRYSVMSEIMEPEISSSALHPLNVGMTHFLAAGLSGLLYRSAGWTLYCLCQIAPRGSPALLWFCGIDVPILASHEQVVVRIATANCISPFIQF